MPAWKARQDCRLNICSYFGFFWLTFINTESGGSLYGIFWNLRVFTVLIKIIPNSFDRFSSPRWAELQRAVEGQATRTWEGWDRNEITMRIWWEFLYNFKNNYFGIFVSKWQTTPAFGQPLLKNNLKSFFPQVRKDKGGAGYKSMGGGGGGGGKSNGNAAQPSRLTMSRLEQVFFYEKVVIRMIYVFASWSGALLTSLPPCRCPPCRPTSGWRSCCPGSPPPLLWTTRWVWPAATPPSQAPWLGPRSSQGWQFL